MSLGLKLLIYFFLFDRLVLKVKEETNVDRKHLGEDDGVDDLAH